MANPWTYMGRRHWSTNQQVTAAALNNVADSAISVALGLLATVLCWDPDANTPISGFVGSGCLVSISSGLTLSVAAGIGIMYSASETDAFLTHYKPIVVSTATTTTLDAHSAQQRIDVLSLAPATTDDTSSSARIIDPALGTVSTASVSTRRRFAYTLTVTKGTPAASPSAPATPSGNLKIAEVLVPASSGAVTVRDCRAPLWLGPDIGGYPREHFAADHVPGTGTELQVSALSGMSLAVARGVAYIDGRPVSYNRSTVTIGAAEPLVVRVDTVYADGDGNIGVNAGTAGSTTPAAILSDEVALAYITVNPAVTSIGSGNITDARIRGPYGPLQLQSDAVTTAKILDDAVTTAKIAAGAVTETEIGAGAVTEAKIGTGAVTANKIAASAVVEAKIDTGAVTEAKVGANAITATKTARSNVFVVPELSAGSEVADTINVTITCKDADGTTVAEAIDLIVVVRDTNGATESGAREPFDVVYATGGNVRIQAVSTGTVVKAYGTLGTDATAVRLTTNASGVAIVAVWTDTAQDRTVDVQVLDRPGGRAITELTFS